MHAVDVSLHNPLRSHAEYNVATRDRTAGQMVRAGNGFRYAAAESRRAEAAHVNKQDALLEFQDATRERVRRRREAEHAVQQKAAAAKTAKAAVTKKNLKYCAANYITNAKAHPPPPLRVEVSLAAKATVRQASACTFALVDLVDEAPPAAVFVDLDALAPPLRPAPRVSHKTSSLSQRGVSTDPSSQLPSTLLHTTLGLGITKTA